MPYLDLLFQRGECSFQRGSSFVQSIFKKTIQSINKKYKMKKFAGVLFSHNGTDLSTIYFLEYERRPWMSTKDRRFIEKYTEIMS